MKARILFLGVMLLIGCMGCKRVQPPVGSAAADQTLAPTAQVTSPTPVAPKGAQGGRTCVQVVKHQRKLFVWRDGVLQHTFPIGLGFAPEGHKQEEGDGKTPEGTYYVCTRNNASRYYLSLGLSYPNASDAAAALQRGSITQREHDAIVCAINAGQIPPWNTPLGGEIMLHGRGAHRDWTAGCVAVEDVDMDILWALCRIGTQVFIEP